MGRTLLSAAFDLRLHNSRVCYRTLPTECLSITTNKINFRDGGQECPPHTVRTTKFFLLGSFLVFLIVITVHQTGRVRAFKSRHLPSFGPTLYLIEVHLPKLTACSLVVHSAEVVNSKKTKNDQYEPRSHDAT